MIYKGKLVKVSDNPNALRTNEIEGWSMALPEVGESFRFFSDPLDKTLGPEYVRIVTTSVVQRVETIDKTEIFFITMNSTYKFTDIIHDENEIL